MTNDLINNQIVPVAEDFLVNIVISELPIIHNKEDINLKIDKLFSKMILKNYSGEYYLNSFVFHDQDIAKKEKTNKFKERHLYASNRVKELNNTDTKNVLSYVVYPDDKQGNLVVYLSKNKGTQPDLKHIRNSSRNDYFNKLIISLIYNAFTSNKLGDDISKIKTLGKSILCPITNPKTNFTTGFDTEINFRNNNVVFNLKLSKFKGGNDLNSISNINNIGSIKLTKHDKKRANIATIKKDYLKSRHYAYMLSYNILKDALEYIGILNNEISYFRNEYVFLDFLQKEKDSELNKIKLVYYKKDYEKLSEDDKKTFYNLKKMMFEYLKVDYEEDSISSIDEIINNINIPIIFIDLSKTIYNHQKKRLEDEENTKEEEVGNIFTIENDKYVTTSFSNTFQIIRNDSLLLNKINNNFDDIKEHISSYDLYTQIKIYNIWAYKNNRQPIVIQNVKFDNLLEEKGREHIFNKILNELYIKKHSEDKKFINSISKGKFDNIIYLYVHNYAIKQKTINNTFISYISLDTKTEIATKGWDIDNETNIKELLGITGLSIHNPGYYIIFNKKDYIYKPEQSNLPHMIINQHNINNPDELPQFIQQKKSEDDKEHIEKITRSLKSVECPYYGLFYPQSFLAKSSCLINFKENDMWIYFNYNKVMKANEHFIALDKIQLYRKTNPRMSPIQVNIKDYPEYCNYYLKNITNDIIKNDDISKSNIFFKFIHNIID